MRLLSELFPVSAHTYQLPCCFVLEYLDLLIAYTSFLHHIEQAKLYRLFLLRFYPLLPDLLQFVQSLRIQPLVCMYKIK